MMGDLHIICPRCGYYGGGYSMPYDLIDEFIRIGINKKCSCGCKLEYSLRINKEQKK